MSEQWIDVSAHQGIIDWKQVAAAGIKGVIIRAGYGNSASQIDKQFLANIEGALAAGITVAVYWFNYFDGIADAQREWNTCRSIIDPYRSDIKFISSDYEYDSVKYYRKVHGAAPSNSLINQMIDAFCSAAAGDGWDVKNYFNNDYRRNILSSALISKWRPWLADYTGGPDISCDIQQTSSTGRVAGIRGNVDMDTCFVAFQSRPAPIPTPASSAPSKAGIKAGDKVQYSGSLYADSYGNGQGKTVSGTFIVQRVIDGRKCGVLLPAGWVPASACKAASSASVPAPSAPSKAGIKSGDKVQYSGPLYSDSYGSGQGKTVSGTFTVQRVVDGRKCGVLLPAGWVPASLCKPV